MSAAATVLLSNWDNSIPVLLPYGERTMDGVVAASIGTCIPFALFILSVFNFLYGKHFKASYNNLMSTVYDGQTTSKDSNMTYSFSDLQAPTRYATGNCTVSIQQYNPSTGSGGAWMFPGAGGRC